MPKQLVLHLLVLSALLFILQPIQDLLIYRRSDILEGEIWRLFTSSLIHINYTHLGLNLAGLWIAVYLFYEVVRIPLFYGILSLLSLGVGIGLFYFSLNTEWYAGFSGALYGLFFTLAFMAVTQNKEYLMGGFVMFVILGKVIWDEMSGGKSAQASADLIGAPVLTFSHFLGVMSAIGICVFLWGYQTYKKRLDKQ